MKDRLNTVINALSDIEVKGRNVLILADVIRELIQIMEKCEVMQHDNSSRMDQCGPYPCDGDAEEGHAV